MPAASDLIGVRDVLRALRRGPVTIAQIAKKTKLSAGAVYRMIGKLEVAGVPLIKTTAAWEGRGMPPSEYTLTAEALIEWIDQPHKRTPP
jgi:predicted ArsR family transcriptional regulator